MSAYLVIIIDSRDQRVKMWDIWSTPDSKRSQILPMYSAAVAECRVPTFSEAVGHLERDAETHLAPLLRGVPRAQRGVPSPAALRHPMPEAGDDDCPF